jgi:Rab3 GTPase-activating protein catalytic subunit
MPEEEYTDYSCSTAIERLSRDVETVLRTWHVDRGSDHHVTIAESHSTSGFSSRRSSSVSLAATTAGGDEDLASIRIIRSNTLAWNMTLSTQQYGRCSITIDLELALWDAPRSARRSSSIQRKQSSSILEDLPERSILRSSSGKSLVIDDDDDEQDARGLVRSLIRKPFGEMPAHDFLFDNFSALFGIGQHISLTPIHPHPLPPELVDSIGESILQRHDGDSTARWVLASTLSGWLQTALNVATANCQTCIPTFGVWGQYRPNELLLNTMEEVGPPLQVPSNGSNGSDNNKKSVFRKSNSQRKSDGPPSQSRRADRSVDASSGGPQDWLVGRTIQTEEEQQQQRDLQRKLSFASSVGGMDRDGYRKNGVDFNYKKKGGVQLFPNWAQTMQKAEIPQVLFASKSRKGALPNSQFSPPFVVGNVLTPRKSVGDSLSVVSSKTKEPKSRRGLGATTKDSGVSYHVGANLWVSVYSTNASKDSHKNTVPAAEVLASRARLSVWAGVLLQHCPEDSMVVLTGARHVFGWLKDKNTQNASRSLFLRALDGSGRDRKQVDTAWRMGGDEDEYQHGLAAVMDLGDDEFLFYKKQCQFHAQELLEEAWGCKDRKMPLWGPSDDPVASVYATTTWNGKISPSQTAENDAVVEPLLTFPLRIRSRRELSKQDWSDMEESVEMTILDPTTPSRFCVQTYYDRETNVSTLAANQRCVLAALIRASTLPNETLLHHLTDVNLISLWDDASGRQVARKIAERSGVGNGTKAIVDAMDWSTAAEELISIREAEYVVHSVMNGSLTAGFPSSPEDSFNEHDLLSPFRKSAPWGRLVSVLFAHMARLRALPSVALVWRVFCQELRRRWNAKESLPNMQYVAGLDPHPLELYEKRSFSSIGHKANFAAFLNCTEPDPDDFNCLIGQKLQVFNLGVECIVACELLENEVLENFLGAGQLPTSLDLNDEEMKGQDVPSVASTSDGAAAENISIEAHRPEKKWPKSNLRNMDTVIVSEETNYGPPTIDRDLDFWVMDEPGYTPTFDGGNIAADVADDTGFDYVAPAANNLDDGDDDSLERALRKKAKKHKSSKDGKRKLVVDGLPDQQWHGTIMDGDGSEGSLAASGTLSQAYFDAAEAGSIFSSKNGFVTLDTVVNVADMKRRPGARCPVANAQLSLTGDQVYAPYLQRPYPVTDDVALERRIMLAKSCDGEERRGALQNRLEISQRMQKAKLLSDMSAFKAANPLCTIDDFTRWYGNPGSPLDDYSDDMFDHQNYSVESALQESAAKKLDRASEAMRVLVATREFWGKTWEEAKPVPAAEQEPLFDYSTTVEMILDYLEQLHPANLLNQVMAVNLSSAYFVLASSAKGTMKIGIVQLSMKKLRHKTERALELLSRDATGVLSHVAEGGSTAVSTNSSQYASEDAIAACEDACNALSVTETMIARATSLLYKFPGQYKLISDLLRFADGSTLALVDREGRRNFLNLIYEQQQQQGSGNHSEDVDPSKDNLPNPLLREYVFRNLDDENPAQLAVRFGEEGGNPKDNRSASEGGVLLALMKCNAT